METVGVLFVGLAFDQMLIHSDSFSIPFLNGVLAWNCSLL